jgi:hypothetical protein
MYNFEEIKKALEPYKGRINGGIFDCFGSDSPDQFETIYYKDGVTILHNTYYDYMDVVGLSEEHFKCVADMCAFDYEAEEKRIKEEMIEYELQHNANTINQTISIMTGYFSGDINENELIDLLMSVSDNNKYVKEHILNIITDCE